MAPVLRRNGGSGTLTALVAIVVAFAAVTPVAGEHGPEAPTRGTFATFTANSPTEAPSNPMHLTALVVDGEPRTKGTNGEKTGSFQELVITAADPVKFVVAMGVGTAVGTGVTVRVEDFSGKFSWSTLDGTSVGNIKLNGVAAYVSLRDASGFVIRVEDVNANAVNDFLEDSDADRLTDGTERHDHGTNPFDDDSDDDTFSDGEEILDLGSDPNDPDDPVPRVAPPGAPRNLDATRGPGPGQISLSWDPPSFVGSPPLTEYEVFRTSDRDEVLAFTTTETSGVDSRLPPGTFFSYRVRAVNANGPGPFSDSDGDTTFRLPSAPQDLVARSGPGRGEVSLQWQAPADTDGREVIQTWLNRGTTPDHLSLYRFVTGLSFVDEGNDDGETFYYTVQAQTDVGLSDPSNGADATTHTHEPEIEATLPAGVALTSALWQGHYAYVFGGTVDTANGTESTDAVVRFDPGTGEALNLSARLPSPRHGTSAVWTGAESGGEASIQSCHPACSVGLGYIFGGDALGKTTVGGATPTSCHPACAVGSQILEFNPVDGTFTQQGAVIDPPRTNTSAVWVPAETDASIQSCHPACAIGFGYIIGGAVDKLESSGPTPSSCHPACAAGTDILRYDPINDEIQSTNGILPEALEGVSSAFVPEGTTIGAVDDEFSTSSCHPACIVGGIFIFGGKGSSTGLSVASAEGDQILFYDLEEDRVVTVDARLPSPRAFTSAFFDGRYVFVIGGSWNGVAIDEIVRFDPRTLEVKVVTELPSERSETSVAFDGESGHVFGGQGDEAKLDEIVRFTPSAPQGVEATRGPGRGEVTVSWQPPAAEGLAPVSGYRVYVGTSSNGQGEPVEVGADVRSYTASGFGDGVALFFKVSATSDVGEGPQSREVSAKTFETPSAPQNLDVVFPGSVGFVHLVWEPPASSGGAALTKYEVLRAIDSPAGPGELAPLDETAPDVTEYRDTTCDLPEFCRYAVRARNVVGEGPLSNQVTGIGTQVPSV